jgi:uncharacterized protein YciI
MQFLVIAHDYSDALARRMNVRPKHISAADELIKCGKLLYGVAILNAQEQLAGSVMLFEVESRKELDDLLKAEVYVTAKVWEKVEIFPARLGPSFEKLKPALK